MDGLQEEPDWRVNGGGDDDFQVTQDSLIQDIVSDLGVSSHGQRPPPVNGAVSDDVLDKAQRYNSISSRNTSDPGVDRHPSNASSAGIHNGVSATYNWDSEESDPEGAAGLLAMQDDMDDHRFGGITFPAYMEPLAPALPPPPPPTAPQLPQPPEEQVDPKSNYGGMDIAMYGGGYAGNLHYGNGYGSPPAPGVAPANEPPRPLPIPQGQAAEYPPFS
jgi:hypothetical protein